MNDMTKLTARIERNLGWIVLTIVLVGCLLVLWPFVSALLWAVVLCFSTWPLYQRLLKWLGGRKTWAAAIMTLAMMLVVLMPFIVIGSTLADSVKELSAAARHSLETGPPEPPAWLVKIPVFGQSASAYWASVAADTSKLVQEIRRFIEPASAWLLKVAIALAGGLLELTLSIFVAFFLFRDGVSAAQRLTMAVVRIGGERGRHLLTVAGNTVRGVVYGILGTALVQAVMAGVGFVIAGVPGAALLAFLTFFLSVIPMGPPLVWVPAVIWLFEQGSTGMGVFMLIWGLGVSSVDNVVKPWLISQGSDLPFILIFFGVLGGALAFGFIGVFLGPTLLAVGFRLMEEWFATARPEDPLDAHAAKTLPPV
jgi:predicted PurR-regulated permease PerM